MTLDVSLAMNKNMRAREKQGSRQSARQRERDRGWLKVKRRLVLVQ